MSSKVKQVADAAAPVVKRDVNKFVARIRQFLMLVSLPRSSTTMPLFTFSVTSLPINGTSPNGRNGTRTSPLATTIRCLLRRSQPQPFLPSGFAHKLSKNYYFDRDARRQVGQPQVLFSTTASHQLLANTAAAAP